MKRICYFVLVLVVFCQELLSGQQPLNRLLDEINQQASAEAYPWLSADAQRLYFLQAAWNRPGTVAFASRPIEEKNFKTGISIFPWPDFNVASFGMTPDERMLFLLGTPSNGLKSSLFYSTRPNLTEPFSQPESVTLNPVPVEFASSPSPSPDASELFVFVENGMDFSLWVYERAERTRYERKSIIVFPHEGKPQPGQLSRDGLKYSAIFQNESGKRVVVQATRPALNAPFGIWKTLPLELPAACDPQHISLANSDQYVLSVTQQCPNWYCADLLMAGPAHSLGAALEVQGCIQRAFSHPTNGATCIEIAFPSGSVYGQLVIADAQGKTVLHFPVDKSLPIIEIPSGLLPPGKYVASLRTPSGQTGSSTMSLPLVASNR